MERAVLYRVPKELLEFTELFALYETVRLHRVHGVQVALVIAPDFRLHLCGQILVRRDPGAQRGSYDVREVPRIVLVQGLDHLSAPLKHRLDQGLDETLQRVLETRPDRDVSLEPLEVLDLFGLLHPLKGPGHVDELGVHATQVLSRDVRGVHVTVPNLSGHDVFSERKVVSLRLVHEPHRLRGHREEPVQETSVKLEFLVLVEFHDEIVHHVVLGMGVPREGSLNRSGHVVFAAVPLVVDDVADQVHVVRAAGRVGVTEQRHPRGSLGSVQELDELFVRDGLPVPPLNNESRGELLGVTDHLGRGTLLVPGHCTGFVYHGQRSRFRLVVQGTSGFSGGSSERI